MAEIHLDTSFLIRALLADTPQALRLHDWLRRGAEVGISAVAWAEFLCGPLDHDHVGMAARIVPDPTPFRADEAELTARLFNLVGRRRGSLTDCMIAATAMGREAALATSNAADYRRLEGAGLSLLSCEDSE